MLRRHIVLLVAILLSDGDVKPGGPLGDFREEQAMGRHLPLSSHTTQLHYTNSYTYSHPNLNFLQYRYTIQILFPHVMWSAQVVRDSKIDHTQCHLSTFSWIPKRVIVQWVGIGTHTHTQFYIYKRKSC